MPRRRVDQRLGPHGDRGRRVVLVGPEGERVLRPAGLDEPLLARRAVHDAQLRRCRMPLLHHQVGPEHVARRQAGFRRSRDDLGPVRPPGRQRGGPDQPELLGAVVGDEVELAAVRAVGVVRTVLGAAPSWFQDDRRLVRGGRRDGQGLRCVPGLGLNQHVAAAAGGPDDERETLVVLAEHPDVARGAGSEFVPPHLVRTVLLVGEHVEQRPGVRGPGEPVVGRVDAVGQVFAGGQVTDAELEQLVAGEVHRVRQQPAVRADLADPEVDVAAGAGRIAEQQVRVEQHLGRLSRRGHPAELLEFLPLGHPGEVAEPAPAPGHRVLRGSHPRGHLGKQPVLQRAGWRRLLLVIRALRGQVVAHRGQVMVAHPRVRVVRRWRARLCVCSDRRDRRRFLGLIGHDRLLAGYPATRLRSSSTGIWREVFPSRPVTVTDCSRLLITASSVASATAAK